MIASKFELLDHTPSFKTQCARKMTSFLKKAEFRQLQFKIVLSKSVKDNAQVMKMFFSCL